MSEILKNTTDTWEKMKKEPETLSLTSLKKFVDTLNPNTPLIGPVISFAQKFLKGMTDFINSPYETASKKYSEIIEDAWEAMDDLKETITGKNNSKNTKSSSEGSYATQKPLSNTVKLLKNLNGVESQWLAKKVFGDGFATDLLIKLDDGSGTAIKRMVALWWHEGRLDFWRQNPDPASGFNIGTFQIGGSKTSKSDSLAKYKDCYDAWVKLAKKHGIEAPPMYLARDPAQRDLLAHLGYIQSQRWWKATFDKLTNPNLTDKQVIALMSTKIQGGISAIGKSVVSQMKTSRVDTETLSA